MPTTVTRRPAIRSLEGWAIAMLYETGAIVACERHGWTLDRGDPHALARALRGARDDPPRGFCASDAIAAVEQAISAIGDTCPDCSRPDQPEEMPRFR